MPQQFDPAALQQYYSIAMGQPIAQPMVNPEQLNQYNQQTIPVAVPVSDVESYAQQQFQPQVPMPQQAQQQNPQFQIQKKRMDYAAMIEQRFNEIADHVGGINALVQTNNLDAARKKAADDIGMMFGPPPAIEQPMSEKERVELEQAKLQERKARFDLQQAQEQAKNPEKKPSDLVTQIGKETSTYLVKQKPMIGQLENAIKLAESPNVPINEKLASMKLIGKLMNSVMVGTSDAVSQDEAGILLAEVNEKIKPSGLWTSEAVFGNDLPQFVSKLKNLRDSVTNEYNNSIDLVSEIDPEISKIFKKKTLYSQPQAEGMPQAQPTANEPMRMTSPGAIPFVRDSTGKLIRQQ